MYEEALPSQMVLTALFTARPETRTELHQTLTSLREGILGQPGCLACLVGLDLGGEPRFHLHLAWRRRQDLDAFLASEVFRILAGALKVLTVAAEFWIASAAAAFLPAEAAASLLPPCASTISQGQP